ncbi:MAG: flagellar filament capping protein FliD [Opitutae bacterium]|nr:flagellar filament capping protein FliD [Opitutae bacterium]
MAGIQISGLLSNSAFDWKSVVDQLIAVDGIPIQNLNKEKDTNTQKVAALDQLRTAMFDLKDSLQTLRSNSVFSARSVSADVATTWKSTSSTGAALGSYKFAVQQLATKAQTTGTANIGQGISATDDVSGLTLSNLATATAATAGTLTVNGQQITIALTDSLQSVFTAISTATGGDITATYSAATDKVTLTSASNTPIVLGAANDTSNFFSVLKLANNGTGTVASSASLGTLKTAATLASSGLATALTGQDGSGNGSFTINGVSISYNVNTDTIGSLLSTINQAGAGVTATYDSSSDRVNIVNNSTGDTGMGLADTTGNLLAALGVTSGAGGTFTRGNNALFTVNGGPTLASMSNTLTADVHGITGLSVTVNTQTTQTLQVESDSQTMQGAIQTFVDKFNAFQSLVETSTKITTTSGKVSTSILSDNREVQGWAGSLQTFAFEEVFGLTGTVKRLDHLGIDFNSTTGQLTVKDAGKLASALADHPDDVEKFFLTNTTGFVAKMYGFLTTTIAADGSQQSNLNSANNSLDDQIATLQRRLDNERELLTNAFIKMTEAQSAAQSQNQYLTNTFFKNNSN